MVIPRCRCGRSCGRYHGVVAAPENVQQSDSSRPARGTPSLFRAVKRQIQRYGAIAASLIVLFASGIAAGFRWGQHRTAARISDDAQATVPEATPEQWAESAVEALRKDLGLNGEQTEKVRRSIAGPSREILGERHRANLKIHLRLLEVHDTLARDVELFGADRSDRADALQIRGNDARTGDDDFIHRVACVLFLRESSG